MDTSTVLRSGALRAAARGLLALAVLAAAAATCFGAAPSTESPAQFARDDRSAWLIQAATSAQAEIADAVARRAGDSPIAGARGERHGGAISSLGTAVVEKSSLVLSFFFGAIVVAGFLGARRALALSRRRRGGDDDPWAALDGRALGRPAQDPLRGAANAAPPAVAPVESLGTTKTLWGRILILASSGLPARKIAETLGASIADVELVISLERKRSELAESLAAHRSDEGRRT